MSGSPLATSEGAIDVVTDVRINAKKLYNGETGGIDVRHYKGF